MTPYEEALATIRKNPGTGSSTGLAKLILSLYNPIHPFGFAECTNSFDAERSCLAVRMVQHYLNTGEDDALRHAGEEIYRKWPRLVELSTASNDAKARVRNQWRAEEEARLASTSE